MKEDEESAPRSTSGADKGKKKNKRKNHIHIGPNARAFRAGLAFCPVCDAEKGLRLTEKEREAVRATRPEREIRGSRSYGRDA